MIVVISYLIKLIISISSDMLVGILMTIINVIDSFRFDIDIFVGSFECNLSIFGINKQYK